MYHFLLVGGMIVAFPCVMTSRTVLAYKTGFCIFFSLQEPIFNFLVIFLFVLELGVYLPR